VVPIGERPGTPVFGVGEETQRRPPLVPKGRIPRAARRRGGEKKGRSLLFGAHCWAPVWLHAPCVCGTSVCVVCGASVCVVLQHHWALNEHVHACA